MGSFPVDIDLRFDNASAQRALKDFAAKSKAMMADVAAGVEGSSKRMEKALSDFASGVITNSTRAGRQVENQIRAVERWADAAGKTASQQTQDRYQRMIKSLEGNEKGIQRVTAAMQKWAAVEKDQVKKALDDEIKSLEKRAALMGKSPADRMKIELAERTAEMKGNAEAVNRLTAAYQLLANAEKQEADAARERDIVAVQRRGAMAGMTPAGRLQATHAEELARLGGDPRVAAAQEQELAAAAKASADQLEREVQAIEKRNNLIGASPEQRILAERNEMMAKYNNDARVAAAYEKQLLDLKRQEAQTIEKETQALEREARLTGKSGAARRSIELQEEIKLGKLSTEQIHRRTVAIEEMAVAEKAARGSWTLVARGVRDIFEGRMTYGAMDIGRAAMGAMGGGGAEGAAAGGLAGIGTAGLVAGGGALALGALEIAGYKAAKSMGEYARSIREIQGVTGMTVEQVQKLQIAATMSGRDVGSVTQAMRGFTQALEGESTSSKKAAADLEKMGVNVTGLRYGTIGVYEAFEQMGEALRKNPDVFQRNIEVMDILKKSGLQDVLMLKDLKKAADVASGIHIFTEDEVKEMDELHEKTAKINIALGNIWEQLKFLTAKTWVVSVELATKGPMSDVNADIVGGLAGGATNLLKLFPPGPPEKPGVETGTGWMTTGDPNDAINQAVKDRNEWFNKNVLGDYSGLEGAQRKVQDLTQQLHDLRSDTKENRALAGDNPSGYLANLRKVTTELEQQKALVKSINELETARKNIADELARLSIDVVDRLQHPDELPSEARLRKFQESAIHLPAAEQRAAMAKASPLLQQLIARERADRDAKFAEQKLEQQQTFTREMFHSQFVAPVNIRELGQTGVTRADVESDIDRQYQQRMENAGKLHDLEASMLKDREAAAKTLEQHQAAELSAIQIENDYRKQGAEADMEREQKRYALAQRERDLEREHKEKMSEIQLSDQEDTIKHTADVARKTADLRFHGDSPAESIAAEYRIAVQESHDLFDAEMERIALHETGYKAEEAATQAINKLHREDEAAAEDSAFKLAEMQQKQLDTLKSKIEPLYQTLFTHPKNFGKQLQSTLTEAAIHPIVSGMSEMTSRALAPFMYGPEGTTGIAGMFGNLFGGGAHNVSQIKPVHDAMPVWIMNLPTASRLGPLPSYIGDTGGGAGTSIFPFGAPEGGGGTVSGGFGGRQFRQFITGGPSMGGDYGGGGGGMSMDDILSLPHTSRMGPIYTGGGGGGAGAGGPAGFSSLFKNLRTSFMPQSYTGLGGEKIYPGGPGASFSDNLGGVLSSQAAAQLYMGAGLPLAMAGIAGVHRGTAGGTAESMLGGAGVGAGIGTMFMPGLGTAIGAGVGAAAGLGIGLGEMLAGVESPRHEAIRLAQSLYRIHISNSAADQVVSIAQQNYGGQVSVAIRSPQVRQMLGLYAAGTGQSNLFPQSMDMPHGASLVESGGRLQQQATYQYGQAFSQSSNLPVYGGVPTQTLGAPGGVNLSLNIGGQNAAQFLQGNVVSPDVVSTQYAAAMNSSNGRVSQALMMSEPGSIAS